MVKNQNHPAKGSVIKVSPIQRVEDIEAIRRLLKGKLRDTAIFNLGINTNLRAVDLVNIKVGQVRYLKPGDTLNLREVKTSKARSITLNNTCHKSIQALLNTKEMQDSLDEDFLFRSRKGKKALSPISLNALVHKWTKAIGLKGNFGSHTLRKTFGYMHRTKLGTDIPTLMKMFNHSTQRQTLEYLGIQPEEIHTAYMKEI